MKDYTTDNPVFSDKIPLVERADLVNYENKTKAEKQLLQNDLVLKKQMDTCLGENGKDGNLGLAEGIKADDLVGAVNEVFTLGSEKKKQLVENLTALGITASTSETWEMLLGKVLSLINTSSDTVTAETLLSGYTAHNAAGAKITGTLADKTGTTDHSAEVSIDATNKRLKLKVPATAKYSVGNYLYAAYATIANLIGLTAAKLVKGNTILGITGNNNNMDTSGADAAAGDILSGKKAGVKGSLITGTMPNKGAWTGATTGSGNVAIPAGYHNGSGYVSGAGAYNAGVSATKKGTAGTGDVLAGKTFTNSSSVEVSGTMANKGSTTQDATATQDDTYTYLTVPVAGYYNTASKLRTKNSNLQQKLYVPNPFWLCVTGTGNFGNGTAVGGVSGIWLDLTNVKKLNFSDISVSGSPSTHAVTIRPKNEGHYGDIEETVCSAVLNNGSIAELDVSNLTGVYYLVLAASAKPSSGYKTYKISAKCTVS